MARNNRRSFLAGRAAVNAVEDAGAQVTEKILGNADRLPPAAGNTVRIETRAMACTWQVMLNPGDRSAVMHASDALDLVLHLESLMTVYRDDGQLAVVNQAAGGEPVEIDPYLTHVVRRSLELTETTAGAFDITSGPLVRLWKTCRETERVPTKEEIAETKSLTGVDIVELDESAHTLRLKKTGAELNLGAIGKGYALDCAADFLLEQGVKNFLIHGGASSVLARGAHTGSGWPVGIKNPLLNDQSMVTIVLGDAENSAGRALGTSGGNVQYFRLGGRRYGHILDPRTGFPAEAMLSASVVAGDAMTADALSTAAFVAGKEAVRDWCESKLCDGALLTSHSPGRNVRPEVCQLAPQSLFFEASTAADGSRNS